MSKIKNGFRPVFSGISPSANMVLPTYLRQLQYVEKVLNQLVKDVDDNFIEFDKYNREQFEDIKEIVRRITAGTIEDEVQKEVLIQVQAIIGSFEDIMDEIQEVRDELATTDNKIAPLTLRLDNLQDELENLSTSMNIILSDSKLYTDSKLTEAKLYTDEKINPIEDSLVSINNKLEDIPNQINDKVDPLSTRVTKLETDKVITDAQIVDLGNRLDSSSTVVLGKKVSNLETDVSTIQVKIDNIEATSNPDVSGLVTRIGEAETAINMNTSNLGITNNKVSNLETEVNSINSDLVNIDDRLVVLEIPSETGLEDRVDNLESSSNLLNNRVGSLERLSIEDSLDSLDSRVSTLEELNGEVNPNYPLFLDFGDLGKCYLEINPWEDFVSYKGRLFNNIEADMGGEISDYIYSLNAIPIPLNLDPDSGIPNKVTIYEIIKYKQVRGDIEIHNNKIYIDDMSVFGDEPDQQIAIGISQTFNEWNSLNQDVIDNLIKNLDYQIIIDVDIKIPKVN